MKAASMKKRDIYDTVIAEADILTFRGAGLLRKHYLGIKDGKIASISGEPLEGRRILHGSGKTVLPGFIDFHSHVDGKLFSAECLLRQGATTTIGGERNFDGSLIRRIAENGFLINHGFYISHSFTLRKAAGIDDPYRAAAKGEIDTMVLLAEEFLHSGAFGIHFGLEFTPGTSTEEIVELSKVAKEHNKIIVVHLRKDGPEALETLAEILDIARETGVSVHILHLSYMVGLQGLMETALSLIEEGIQEGLDITADTGLYDAFPACIGAPILDGDLSKKYGANKSVGNIVISSGIRAGQACDERSFAFLREKYPNTLITAFVFDENEIKKAVVKPYVYVSTNAADGPHYENVGHPETAGTFPRLLGKYVRELEILTLEEAVKKITLYPALRFGLQNKGEIGLGMDGDLVVVDLHQIRDCADYIGRGNPNAPPEGIEYVFVNGNVAFAEGVVNMDAIAGRMLPTM